MSTGGGDLNYLHWTNFVPEMDAKLDELAKKWGDANKVNVKVEHININDVPARRAAAIQAKSGPTESDNRKAERSRSPSTPVRDSIMTMDKESAGGQVTKADHVLSGAWKAMALRQCLRASHRLV